jgi:plastocyanin
MKPLVASLAAGLFMAGCSLFPNASLDSAEDRATNAVSIQGLAFAPGKLTVPMGTRVSWSNKDDVKHIVTSGKPGRDAVPGVSKGTPAKPTGIFDQAMAPSGSTFAFTFDKAGTYTYFCRIHSSMRGVIVVR